MCSGWIAKLGLGIASFETATPKMADFNAV